MRNKITKLLTSAVLLLLVFSIVGCGEYTPAINSPADSTAGDTAPETSQIGPSGDTPDENAYTVTLRHNGEPYVPEDEIFAHWTDGYSFYNAAFNENGVAATGDLDGNYNVTLSAVPDKLVYNPNIYVATADERNVVIDLYDISKPVKGTGKGLYKCYELEGVGIYRAKIEKASAQVYYQFVPLEEGIYVVESWVDVTAGIINPKADLYTGTFAAKFAAGTLDDGGVSRGYTKNFRYEINVDASMIGNVYTFAIHVETKATEFSPVEIDFAISRNGSYFLPTFDNNMEIPTELYSIMNNEIDKLGEMSFEEYRDKLAPFTYDYQGVTYGPTREIHGALGNRDPDDPNALLFKIMGADNRYFHVKQYLKSLYNEEGTLVYPEIREGGKNIFKGSMFKLNPEDGFYHLYDEEKYADNGGYGPTLYAAISTPCRFLESALINIEDAGNKNLTILIEDENGEMIDHNYKHFLEGYDDLSTWSGSPDFPPYYCAYDCPCHNGGRVGLACPEGCDKCTESCRPCREELLGGPGYADLANRDGYFPVTEEFRVFLQRLSETQRYFNDGTGWVESNPVVDVDALQDDQWLFACAYYIN